MAMRGPEGVRRAAANNRANTHTLREKITSIPGVRALSTRPFFREIAVKLWKPATTIIEMLAKENIVAGVALGEDYPKLGDALFVRAAETKTATGLDRFVDFQRRTGA